MLKISQKVAKKYVAPKIKMLLKSYPQDAKIFALLFIFSSRVVKLTCQKNPFSSFLQHSTNTIRSAVSRRFFTTSGVGFYFSCRGMSILIWYGGVVHRHFEFINPPLTTWIAVSNQRHTNAHSAPQCFSQCVKKCLENWPYVTVLTKSKNKKVVQRCFNSILPVWSVIIFKHYCRLRT